MWIFYRTKKKAMTPTAMASEEERGLQKKETSIHAPPVIGFRSFLPKPFTEANIRLGKCGSIRQSGNSIILESF